MSEQLTISGASTLYFSYGQILAYDRNEAEPGSIWTDKHVSQGFVRRKHAIGISTLLQQGNSNIRVFRGRPATLEGYERVVAVPIVLDSGVLCIEGTEEYPIERIVVLPANTYRMFAAQSKESDTELKFDLFLEPLCSLDAHSEILKADPNLHITSDLLETGEVAT